MITNCAASIAFVVPYVASISTDSVAPAVACCGVPEIVPSLASVRPEGKGSEPDASAKVGVPANPEMMAGLIGVMAAPALSSYET